MSYRCVIGNALPFMSSSRSGVRLPPEQTFFFSFLHGRFFLYFHFLTDLIARFTVFPRIIGTLRYEDGELGLRRGWMSKTRSSPVVSAKNKILKSKQFSLGMAMAIFLSRTNMSTLKDLRTLLLDSYLDGMIDDDEFILLYDHLYDEIFCENPEFPYVF